MTIYCFLELAVGFAVIPGKIIVELFDAKVPRVVENFRALCTGELGDHKYQGTKFHRIVETFTIQGGDTTGTGTGGSHIYVNEEQPFREEDLFWRDIDEEMLLCMAETPPRSQFFITLRSSPHLNGSHCCFGRVIRGQQILKQISELEVDGDDAPLEPVTIARCGELEYQGPSARKEPVQAQTEETKYEIVSSAAPSGTQEERAGLHDRSPAEHGSRQRRRRSGSRARQHDRQSHSPPSRRQYRRSPESSHRRRRDRDHYENSSYHQRQDTHDYSVKTQNREDNGHGIKYKGRGKMVYQSESKNRQSYGRLT